MHIRTAQVALAITVCFAFHADLHAAATKRRAPVHRPAAKSAPAPVLKCGDLVGFQVLMDRQGFSPGQIDGKTGANFTHALAALQSAKKLQPTGQPDCDTWKALGGDSADATITTYTITDADVKGPFEKIPPKLEQQAKLETLGYQSIAEELGERFHSSPALLAQLNRGVPMTAGKEIKVPAVTPFDPAAKSSKDAEVGDITIQVSRDESALRATTRGRHARVLRAGVERQHPRPAAARQLEGHRRRRASGVSLQPGSVLGREAEGREGDDQGRPEQPGRRRLGRAEPRTLRHPRHAGAGATSATPSRTAASGSPTGTRRVSRRS